MATKDPRRCKYRSTLRKLIFRETKGGNPFNPQLPRSRLMLNNYPSRYCIPLKDIQNNHAFRTGHVLLGFSTSGEYLMSYRVKVVEASVSGIPSHTYSLHWWRFNLIQPLHEVCHISLFAGEAFMDELHLIVCHTHNADQILIHGYSCGGSNDQARPCFMTISPSPPCIQCFSQKGNHYTSDHVSACGDSSTVHMKYNLLPPFPLFMPSMQSKLQDTVVVNTVDSLLAISVSYNDKNHDEHRDTACGTTTGKQTQENYDQGPDLCPDSGVCAEIPPIDLRPDFRKQDCTEDENLSDMINDVDHIDNDHCDDHQVVLCGKQDSGKQDCPKDSSLSNMINNTDTISDNDEDVNDDDIGDKIPVASHSKFTQLSSFILKIFSPDFVENNNQELSPPFDDTSDVDIQVTDLHNLSYRLINNLQSTVSTAIDGQPFEHTPPCVHTRIVSLDIERYINEALSAADELKEKYWLLRNYCTQLIDVCGRSECVLVQVTCLVSVQPKTTMVTRQRRCSLSCLFSWNISNGEVFTLDVSPLMDQMKKSDRQVFEEGSKRLLSLRKRCFIPCGLVGIQAFSNHTVFTGKSLNMINHPFQPIAIVL